MSRLKHTNREQPEEVQPLVVASPSPSQVELVEISSSRRRKPHSKFDNSCWKTKKWQRWMKIRNGCAYKKNGKGIYLVPFAALLAVLLLVWSRTYSNIEDLLPDRLKFDSGSLSSSYNDAFVLALDEISQNLQPDGTFMAGAGWTQLWTRDTSYAVQLSLGLLYPKESQKTLEHCTHTVESMGGTTWLQDVCGHFGGWPNLTDAVVGLQGAWSLYLATGGEDFLAQALDISERTLRWAERDVLEAKTGLFKGCSSFMESNSGYPVNYKKNGEMVGQTKALSTNVLYYNGYKIAAQMREELLFLREQRNQTNTLTDNDDQKMIHEWETKANNLATTIRSRLWLEDLGYYAYFEDANETLVTQMEGLGESLLLLAPDLESNQTRIQQIFDKTYRTPKGLPCLWPQFANHKITKDVASYYHNGRIWPFVQGYWALAAAHHGRVDTFANELKHLVELALPNQTFAEFYELDGSFLEIRRRQLWSSAAFVGMVIHGLFGVQLQPRGILFRPIKPKQFLTTVHDTMDDLNHAVNSVNAPIMKLENLRYRKARLTIHVSGSGSVVESLRINGVASDEPFLSADSVGDQFIEISLREDTKLKRKSHN